MTYSSMLQLQLLYPVILGQVMQIMCHLFESRRVDWIPAFRGP